MYSTHSNIYKSLINILNTDNKLCYNNYPY